MRFWPGLSTFVIVTFLFAVPQFAQASIPFFGPIIPASIQTCPAGWAGLIIVINNIISFLITIAITAVAPLTIAYAGYLFVISPISSEGKSKAKEMLWNTVVGIVIALAAYLIVDAVLAVLTPNGKPFGENWQSLVSGGGDLCVPLQSSLSQTQYGTTGGTGGLATGPTTVGGSCLVQQTGACAQSNLTVFGDAATQASQVCFGESRGSPTIASGVDRAQPSGTSVSYGLFQINLTANSVGGLPCPTAFTCPSGKSPCPYTATNHLVNITNADLFNKCVAAATDPTTNIAAAYDIYQKAGQTWKPWGAARRCGLAFMDRIPLLAQACEILSIL